MSDTNKEHWLLVINLGNSIIGVSTLTMPFCFKQCGILLGSLVLLFCTWLTLASCQLLVKAGVVSHRRSYEFLAYHTYGAPGKFAVEIGMIGIQIGTLIAQIVIVGDLGPVILSNLFGVENSSTTRFWVIVTLCMCVGLPLGLIKDLHSVSRASTVCIMFYIVFIIYVICLSYDSMISGSWYAHVNFWRPQGLFQCLPILSFSFGCQTQLFILYEAMTEPSLQAIKGIINSAVNLCALAYLLVGFFGYATFYLHEIPGDVITLFPSTIFAHLMKLGFVISIAIGFPVIIFPCRASIYTLLFQKDFYVKLQLHEETTEERRIKQDDMFSTYIPEPLFKAITVAIVICSTIFGILIPNVEFILGLNGAITGTLICYIFPALFFLRVMSSKAEGKKIAQLVLLFGISILLISTFATLSAQDKGHVHEGLPKIIHEPAKQDESKGDFHIDKQHMGEIQVENKIGKLQRFEPPNPKEPDLILKDMNQIDFKSFDSAEKPANKQEGAIDDIVDKMLENGKTWDKKPAKTRDEKQNWDGGGKDLGKEGNEVHGNIQEKDRESQDKRQKELLDALEMQRAEQEKLLKEQKALLQELKEHKEKDHNNHPVVGLQLNQVNEQGTSTPMQQIAENQLELQQQNLDNRLHNIQQHEGVLSQDNLGNNIPKQIPGIAQDPSFEVQQQQRLQRIANGGSAPIQENQQKQGLQDSNLNPAPKQVDQPQQDLGVNNPDPVLMQGHQQQVLQRDNIVNPIPMQEHQQQGRVPEMGSQNEHKRVDLHGLVPIQNEESVYPKANGGLDLWGATMKQAQAEPGSQGNIGDQRALGQVIAQEQHIGHEHQDPVAPTQPANKQDGQQELGSEGLQKKLNDQANVDAENSKEMLAVPLQPLIVGPDGAHVNEDMRKKREANFVETEINEKNLTKKNVMADFANNMPDLNIENMQNHGLSAQVSMTDKSGDIQIATENADSLIPIEKADAQPTEKNSPKSETMNAKSKENKQEANEDVVKKEEMRRKLKFSFADDVRLEHLPPLKSDILNPAPHDLVLRTLKEVDREQQLD